MKYFSLVLFFALQLVNAQHKVEGTFVDSLPKISSVALYKLVKGNSSYIKYAKVKDKKFVFEMDSLAPGYYRALYRNVKTGFVDFIYNKENVSFEIDSKVGQASVAYTTSSENQLLQAYNNNMIGLRNKLDSVQQLYIQFPKKITARKYKKVKEKVDGAQSYYENLAKDKFCLSVIKSSNMYSALEPHTEIQSYVTDVKSHFFDYVNFEDPNLKNSLFLENRVLSYVFYLFKSDDINKQNELYLKAVNKALNFVKDDEIQEYLLASMLHRFINAENSFMTTNLIAKYKSLPKNTQNNRTLEDAEEKANTLLGNIAPDFKIAKNETLHGLDDGEQYIVVFWSSTCSHCRASLPKLDKFLADKPSVKVVAVGLEKEEDKQGWLNNIKFYPNWRNVLGLNKWQNTIARSYGVVATPSYFILNKDKKIIAKPERLKTLKAFFEQ